MFRNTFEILCKRQISKTGSCRTYILVDQSSFHKAFTFTSVVSHIRSFNSSIRVSFRVSRVGEMPPKGPQSVDTSLHASTSGAAAQLASKHSSPHHLKLYGGWFCPFVQRTWITLVEKSIPHQYIEINPYHKAPEFLELNPRGLVPTLAVPVDAKGETQKPLYESVVICEYLDEVYDDESVNGPSLLPVGKDMAYNRARCRLWIDHVASRVIPCFYRFIQHTPEKPYSIEEVRDEFLKHLKTFASAMAPSKDGPWFLGGQFSMVDVALAPWAMRLFLIEHYKPGGIGIPGFKKDVTHALANGNHDATDSGIESEGDVDAKLWDRWNQWYNAIIQRDSVKQTWSADDMYIEAYKRYAEDTTGSEVGQATRGGRSMP